MNTGIRKEQEASVLEQLRSPGLDLPLRLIDGHLIDGEGTQVGTYRAPVWSFMDTPDSFYEGKYNNRVSFVPRSDGYLATLPIRIAMQNYPTTVAEEVPEGGTVVEIGCAGGIAWFGKRYRMIGIDLSKAALEMASEIYDAALQCDATRMPLADGSVDGVVSSYLFEHLTVEQKHALLTEAFRVLKPGGKIVFLYDLRTDNPVIARYRKADSDLYQRLFLDNDGHLGYEGIEENRAHFSKSGLTVSREIFHERTPVLSRAVWQKLSEWPGAWGKVARVVWALNSGPMRLPGAGLVWLVDATVGRLFPKRCARGMITVAVKP